ncbi:hypothetical protein FOXYSP1_19273 [Fusarium oxysporum f. sp. phaseoli]
MSTCINRERRTPFPPSGTCPTRSQPYGSLKHIVLDVKAGNPRKALMQLLFHLAHPAYHRHKGAFTFKRSSRQRVPLVLQLLLLQFWPIKFFCPSRTPTAGAKEKFLQERTIRYSVMANYCLP